MGLYMGFGIVAKYLIQVGEGLGGRVFRHNMVVLLYVRTSVVCEWLLVYNQNK